LKAPPLPEPEFKRPIPSPSACLPTSTPRKRWQGRRALQGKKTIANISSSNLTVCIKHAERLSHLPTTTRCQPAALALYLASSPFRIGSAKLNDTVLLQLGTYQVSEILPLSRPYRHLLRKSLTKEGPPLGPLTWTQGHESPSHTVKFLINYLGRVTLKWQPYVYLPESQIRDLWPFDSEPQNSLCTPTDIFWGPGHSADNILSDSSH
jgi:hypothetical protein